MRKVFDDYGERFARRRRRRGHRDGLRLRPGRHDRQRSPRPGWGRSTSSRSPTATRGFGASRGTTMSALGMIDGGDVEWRDGELQPAPQSVGRGHWDFPAPIGDAADGPLPGRRAHHRPAPRRDAERADGPERVDRRAAPAAGVRRAAADAGRSSSPPARRSSGRWPPSSPGCPRDPRRRTAGARGFTIDCEAVVGTSRRRGTISGPRRLRADGPRRPSRRALRCAAPGYDRAGALAPSRGVRPRATSSPRHDERRRSSGRSIRRERSACPLCGSPLYGWLKMPDPARADRRRGRSTTRERGCSTAARTAAQASTRRRPDRPGRRAASDQHGRSRTARAL